MKESTCSTTHDIFGYRKKLDSPAGEFRPGSPGIVAFHGDDNVDITTSFNCDNMPPINGVRNLLL